MQKFIAWDIIEDIPNDHLSNIRNIQLVPLLPFLLEHNIVINDLQAREKKLKELHALCNYKTFTHTFDIKDEPCHQDFFQDWHGIVLFMGTKFSLKDSQSVQTECFWAIQWKMFKQSDVLKRLVPVKKILHYEEIARYDCSVAIYKGF